jgi:hypothetical protein
MAQTTTHIGVPEAVALLDRDFGLVVSERTVRRLCVRRAVIAVRLVPGGPWKIDPDSLVGLVARGWIG